MRIDRRPGLGAALAALLAAGGPAAVAAAAGEEEAPAKPAAPDPDAPKVDAPKADAEELRALVKQLGDPDFAIREKAYERLRAAGEKARPFLREGTRSADPQVRWSSERLQRLARGDRPREQALLGLGYAGTPRIEVLPPPAGDRDEFEAAMGRIRERMQDLERRLDEAFRDLPGAGEPREPGRIEVRGSGIVTRIVVGPDGKAKATVTRRGEDGQEVTETFEAGSLEELKSEHPDLFGNLDLRFDVRGDLGARLLRLGVARPDTFLRGGRLLRDDPPPRPPAASAGRPVLGVLLSEVPEVLRTQLDVPAEEGTVVEDVTGGSLAERLGIRRHDVLLRVNGIPVSSAEEVRASVSAVKAGDEVRLQVLRKGKKETLSGKK